ncbi:MAG: amidase [Bacteroidales bacterium]
MRKSAKKTRAIATGLTMVASFLLLLTGCGPAPTQMEAADYNDFEFLEKGIDEIQLGYADGSLTVSEVVQAFLDRIEAVDQQGPALNAIICVNPDAMAIAEALDRVLQEKGPMGPLFGIPVVLKDNIDTRDNMPTTAGSRALETSFPLQDSWVAAKLREAGAVIIGKANLSEWANFRGELSTSGWSGLGGQTKNPYVLSRNPCGSSSGSGVAVSANLCLMAIGTETNGSIVCPSTANGVVGLKPTVGLVSRSGVVPISYTQDSPGPMTRTVRDAAISLGALVGVDPSDGKSIESEGHFFSDYTQFLDADGLQGKRIGFFTGPMNRNFKVDALMLETIEYLKKRGAEIIELDRVTLPNTGGHSFQVMLYEYKDGLNKYFASLGPDAPIKNLEELIAFNESDPVELRHFNQRYLEMAREKGDLTSESYIEALEGMLRGSREEGIDKVMDEHQLDAIVSPTGSPAWLTDWVNGDSFHLGSSSPSAHSGYPIISLPMGFIDGLPVGVSFFGRAYSEPVLLEIAYGFEQGNPQRRVPEFLESDIF